MDGYHHFIGMAKGMGVDFELLSADECGRRHPLMRTDGLLGALWDPLDGDIDPSGLTQALARGARNAGAEIYRFNPVEAIDRKANGEWVVHTKDGDITCEKIVNATGYRVNEVGAMIGVVHPGHVHGTPVLRDRGDPGTGGDGSSRADYPRPLR